MKNRLRTLIRVSVFMLVFVLIFTMVNVFFQPIWLDWNNYYTTYGFYTQPKNTIETVILGPSTLINGVTPSEMYEDYGISVYNMATEQQPMIGSYCWLKETERYHGDTLKTVVMEVSALRSGSKEAYYHKCFDTMRFSFDKVKAVYEHCEEDFLKTLEYLSPVATYHSRWPELEAVDFTKHELDPNSGTRGYGFETRIYADRVGYKNVKIKDTVLDTNVGYTKFREESMYYFDRIVEFCEQENLRLVLVKTPTNNWSDSLHISAQKLADENGLTFIDFNYSPVYEQLDYVHAFDSADGNHMNYYGAAKLSKWLGRYLVENCGATDVRSDERYSFLEDELEEYNNRIINTVTLKGAGSVAEYIELAAAGENTVFITVMDEAENNLKQEQRDRFLKAGLPKLSRLEYRDSYIAVVENGEVIYEALKSSEQPGDEPLSYTGRTLDGKLYNLTSGGFNHGDTTSCTIEGTEHAAVSRGINIVVYNNVIGDVIDSVVFDTFASCYRDSYGPDTANVPTEALLQGEFGDNTILGKMQKYQKNVLSLRDAQLQ